MRLICFILSCFCVFLSYSQENINYFDKYNNQHLETYIFDITFITADDTINKQNLYSLQADSIYLFFYDPFCEHCIGEIKKLKKNKYPQQRIFPHGNFQQQVYMKTKMKDLQSGFLNFFVILSYLLTF